MDIRGDISAKGETFEVEREGVTTESSVKGIRTHYRDEKVIFFVPGTEVQRGDWLQSVDSGNWYYVYDTDTLV